jgi:sialidase-1
VIPSYHDPFSWDDGEFSRSYVMYSDDGGESWKIGGEMKGPYLSNECQAAEIGPNVVLLSARGFGLRRLQAYSHDGGLTFGPTEVVKDLPEPLEGVEGSILYHPASGQLVLSNPSEANWLGFRYNMSIHLSKDQGKSWQPYLVLDKGAVAYSALSLLPDNRVGILYEQSNQTRIIFLPQKIVFQAFSLP